MALRHLELSEMAGLTGPWVGAHRPLLQAIPEVAGWLPRLDDVHARVLKAQPVNTAEMNAEVARISAQQLAVDARHDNLIRAASSGLEFEQYLCRASDPPRLERAELCGRALDTLLPKGLTIINALHVAKAGYAARTRQLVTSEEWLRDLLASIPTAGEGTLLAVVELWSSLGEQLGKLEEQKTSVQARITSTPKPARPEMLAARNAWLALVNMILQTFDLVEGHAQAIETLRAPIARTADVAGKRYDRRDDSTPAEPTPVVKAPTGSPVSPAEPAEPGLPGAKPFA